ncbi:hypothetical protein [Rariglobus hedericola]|uniref:DUF4397 domain-containing protein n=1 Tax=Rariglobus hedericola TaxID=2597822 RepID=A0A556QPG7_9BACT|nr:hypothetical protein [Rariglobus hedericola]TSJ78531.1 hypothetical protein FPL22_04320 [Rariglobus hedericola]
MKTTLLFCLLSGILACPLPQEVHAAEPPVLREICALTLGDTPPPLFFSVQGKYQPFLVGNIERGPANKVPVKDALILFRQAVDAEGKTAMMAMVSVPLPAAPGPLLLVFFYDQSGRTTYRLIEDASSLYAAGTVRLINLSSEPVYCKVKENILTLASQASSVGGSGLVDGKSFEFAYGVMQPDGMLFKSPVKRLRLPREDMRLLILFASRYEQRDGQPPLLTVRDARIYDVVPKTPTPALAQVSSRH